ncbi:hypothetical protein V5O48_007941 [Marasmius crinis-equi]|uniref:Erythromycin biosynthesis protein CIII-like C-terminal domain-containing protein n=1 Tax=Marasmius crinis-equi TaxID=585013 RepID=A0ABR3FFC8_9AGAR
MPPPKILAFTYSEYGQANPTLAILYEIALARPDAELHIASYHPLEKRLPHLQALIDRDERHKRPQIVFHPFEGLTNMQTFDLHHGGMHTFPHPGGVRGVFEACNNLDYIFAPLEGREYLECLQQCAELMETVQPNIVIIDFTFKPPIDACRKKGQRFVVLNTTSFKECVGLDQPDPSALLWKYPATGTGYPYPLPWYLIPFNVFVILYFYFQIQTKPRFKMLDAYRKEHAGLQTGFYEVKIQGAPYLCPSFPETDFPFHIPEHVTGCGPIIFPFVPVEEADPELAAWLENGPTVLVNLGSHVISDKEFLRELGMGLRIMFASVEGVQVLWKVKLKVSGDRDVVDGILGEEIKRGRLRLVEWLKADPVSALVHSNVVCTVHHGGANSFNEGVWAGVPHIILPVWYDTYDFASRVEYLGIGIYGSRTCSPRVESGELGRALVRAVGSGEEAERFRENAGRFRDICKKRGNGREIGAKKMLDLAGL